MDNYHQKFESVNDKDASTTSQKRILKLIFSTGVSSPEFTGKKIRGAGGGNDPIGVILVDSHTHQKVISGPVASAKVKIVLLPGDFGGATAGDGGVWTAIEFENSVISNWKKKKNILVGDVLLVLKDGSGSVGEIKVKHDRNYLSKGIFRLGALAVDYSGEVQEAISDPFQVKDRRNEVNPLLSTDHVGKLKYIGKKGRKRLEEADVKTVKNFLDMLSSNPRALQKIYGSGRRKWEMTIRHAQTSVGNVGNAQRLVEPVFQQPLYETFPDCIEFDEGLYEPRQYDNDQSIFDNMMRDSNFSIHDILDDCAMMENHGLKPYQAYREDGTPSASTMVSGGWRLNCVKAKKRWTKLSQVWFLKVFFTKKVGLREWVQP